jgi:hypothetical protein
MRGRRGQADLGGDLLDREPGIVLQKPQNADVNSVKVRARVGLPETIRSIIVHDDDNTGIIPMSQMKDG